MTAFSAKNAWRNRGAFLLLLAATALPSAQAEWENDYKIRLQEKVGYHLFKPRDLATLRSTIEAEDSLTLSDSLRLQGGVRAYVDFAYKLNDSRYPASLWRKEGSEFLLRDLYLQYQQENIQLRLGNQQIVWGEAFGAFYSDIVNPKDFREFLLGDLADHRLPVPAANAKLIFVDSSYQLILIPKPYFHKLPAQGSDFAARFGGALANLSVDRAENRSLPLKSSNFEIGGKGNWLVSGYDLSLFYFYYFDRQPNYRLAQIPGTSSFVLRDERHRLQTAGFNLTKDLEGYLLRFEATYTKDRFFDGFTGGAYTSRESDQALYVAGLDFTQFPGTILGLQFSQDFMLEPFPGSFRKKRRDLFSLHANYELWRQQNIDLIFSYSPTDGGTLTQLYYLMPLSSQLELKAGADVFQGSSVSEFGQFRPASRAYIALKGYFSN